MTQTSQHPAYAESSATPHTGDSSASLRHFHVRYEAMGFTARLDCCEGELDVDAARGFSETAKDNGLFPPEVIKVVSGYITPDDAQDPADTKLFVSVTLLVQAQDGAAVSALQIPDDVLTRVGELIPGDAGQLDLDTNSWQVMEIINPDLGLSADMLEEKYGHLHDHVDHPVEVWQADVETRSGYWAWVANRIDQAEITMLSESASFPRP